MKFVEFIQQVDVHLVVRYGRQPFIATDAGDNPPAFKFDDIREFWGAGWTPAQAAALIMRDYSSPALENIRLDEWRHRFLGVQS